MRSLKSLFNYKTLCFCIIFILVSLFCYNYFIAIPESNFEANRMELREKTDKGLGIVSYCFRNTPTYRNIKINAEPSTYEQMCWLASEMNKRNWVTPPETSINGDGYTDIGLYNAFGDNPDEFVVFFSFNKYGIITYCDSIMDYNIYNHNACEFFLDSLADLYLSEFKTDDDFCYRSDIYMETLGDFISNNHPAYRSVLSLYFYSIGGRPPAWIEFKKVLVPEIRPYLIFIDFVLVCFCISNILYLLLFYLIGFGKVSLKDYVKSLCKLEWVFVPLSVFLLFIALYFRVLVCLTLSNFVIDVVWIILDLFSGPFYIY